MVIEISGNLNDNCTGVKNYALFLQAVASVYCFFCKAFGSTLMETYDIFFDNATAGSGLTPITTPTLKKYLTIKLNIHDASDRALVLFQSSHELTHCVFFAKYGLSKPRADDHEEEICSASSLITIKNLAPEHLERYKKYVAGLEKECYRKGFYLAEEVQYDIYKLRSLIL